MERSYEEKEEEKGKREKMTEEGRKGVRRR